MSNPFEKSKAPGAYAETENYTQYYNSDNLDIGSDNGGTSRTFIQFALPTLPAGAVATDAIFSLDKRNTTTATSEEIDVDRVTTSWPYSMTWNTPSPQPTVDTTEEAVADVVCRSR